MLNVPHQLADVLPSPQGSSGAGRTASSQTRGSLDPTGAVPRLSLIKMRWKKRSDRPEAACPYAQGLAHNFRWVSILQIPVPLTLCRVLDLLSLPLLHKIEEYLFSSPGRRPCHARSIADFYLEWNYTAFLRAGIKIYGNRNKEGKYMRRQQPRVQRFHSLGHPFAGTRFCLFNEPVSNPSSFQSRLTLLLLCPACQAR